MNAKAKNESARSANGHNIVFQKILLICEALDFRDFTSIISWNFVKRGLDLVFQLLLSIQMCFRDMVHAYGNNSKC